MLASAAAGDRFVFPLDLKGLSAEIDKGGDVVYRDKAGVERARTPHGFMTDANVDPRSAEAPMSTAVTYALIPYGKGGTALEVRLDKAWLADPTRVWPVVVDPQIAVATYADDTYVMSGFHRDNSHDLELKVGTYDGGAHVGRAFVQFDTSAINGKTINWAQLHIAEAWSWNCASAWPVVHRVTAPWVGSNLQDWPGTGFDANPAGGVVSADGACNSRLVVYDVTSAAAVWAANNHNDGLVLDTSAGDNNAWKKFASSETGAPAALHVNWSEPPPPSTGNPFGSFEWIYGFVGGVWVKGWAIDPDTAAPIDVHVYRDGAFVEALSAKAVRTDVGAAYPPYGSNHGVDDFAPMSAGTHSVCLYAINVGGGSTNPSLGCRSVVVPARGANEPFGGMDGTVGPGGIQIRGWTIDPDTAASITVQVCPDLGYVTTIDANTLRTDVGAAYPGYGNYHGLDSFVYLPAGYHNVCAFAMNTAAGSASPLLGCAQATVPAPNPPAAPTNAASAAFAKCIAGFVAGYIACRRGEDGTAGPIPAPNPDSPIDDGADDNPLISPPSVRSRPDLTVVFIILNGVVLMVLLEFVERLAPQSQGIKTHMAEKRFRQAVRASTSEERAAYAKDSVRRLERRLRRPLEVSEYKLALHRLALLNELLANDSAAISYASTLLSMYPDLPPLEAREHAAVKDLLEAWDLFRDGHLLLGRSALSRDNVVDATSHLLTAGRTPTTPAQESFGPELGLAKGLLERGCRIEVLEYIQELSLRWIAGKAKTKIWAEDLQRGDTPKDAAWS